MPELPYAYEIRDARDRDAAERLAAFLHAEERPYHRETQSGHVTGSGFVVSPCRRFTLLMHHAKLDRWLQPGGHCDGSADVAAVAAREIAEETGATARLISPALFDIDIHEIPARGAEPVHLHYDLRFLFEADPEAPLCANSESRGLAWVALDGLERFAEGRSVTVLREKLPHWS